jgi:hypothetical protein
MRRRDDDALRLAAVRPTARDAQQQEGEADHFKA